MMLRRPSVQRVVCARTTFPRYESSAAAAVRIVSYHSALSPTRFYHELNSFTTDKKRIDTSPEKENVYHQNPVLVYRWEKHNEYIHSKYIIYI